MKLTLQLNKTRFAQGESVDLALRLTNTGPGSMQAPILDNNDNDQPVYILTRPGQAKPETFTIRSVKSNSPQPLPPSPPVKQELPPGEYFETGFDLQQMKKLTEPGQYTIAAKLDWDGNSVAAPPVPFTIEASSFLAATISVDAGVDSARRLRVIWIGRQGSGRALGQSFFYEKRPDLGEFLRSGSSTLRGLGAQAQDPFAPQTNFDRGAAPATWYGWREGKTLYALELGVDPPQSFDLGPQGIEPVWPALMDLSGDLDVLGFAGGAQQLVDLRFRPNGGKPSVLWTTPLPMKAVSGTATLSLPGLDDARHAVAVGSVGDTLVIQLVTATRAGKAAAGRTLRLRNVYAFPSSTPAIYVDRDGQTRVAVVISRNAEGTDLAILDVTFPANGDPRNKVTPIEDTEGKIRSAAAAFRIAENGPLERAWAILLENGRLLDNAAPAGRAKMPHPPAVPLQLLRMSGATYLLLLGEQSGPEFASLR